MKKVKIQLTKLFGKGMIHRCSFKQLRFIEDLMSKRNMSGIFNRYFKEGDKYTTITITMKEASKLIDSLLKDKEIIFKEAIPIMEENELVNPILIQPKKTFVSIPKISYEEQQILKKKYEDNL